jgi:hypothetical protein
MSTMVVLAVGLDGSFLKSQLSDCQSTNFCIRSVGSIREAIVHLREGDFDLVLLGRSIPSDNKERLTFLIRASGSRVPVVCLADSSCGSDNFVGPAINDESIKILDGIKEMVANRAKTGVSSLVATSISI